MADRVRVSTSVSPQVLMTDADADDVWAVQHDIGRTVGSSFNKDVSKWAVDLAKNVTSTGGAVLIGSSPVNEYSVLYLKNTGFDSSGDAQTRAVSLSLDTGSSYNIRLSAGESIAIPITTIVEEDIYIKCSSASGIVCEYVGGYTS